MSKKTISILLAVFIILLIISASPWWRPYLNFGRKQKNEDKIGLSSFNKQSVDKISILESDVEEKILVKKEGGWMIDDFKASEKEIDDFFEILSSLEFDSLASKNPENHKNFEATEDKGFVLSFDKNGSKTTFIIGKRGPLINSFYAKKKGEKEVYLVLGDLRTKLARSIDAWRDKVIISVSQDNVSKIEIASKDKSLTIIKDQKKGEWLAKAGEKETILEKEKTDSLFSALGPLEASGFLNEEEKLEFKNAFDKTICQIFDNQGKIFSKINLLEKDTQWWGQVEGEDIFYKISSYKISDLILEAKNLFSDK